MKKITISYRVICLVVIFYSSLSLQAQSVGDTLRPSIFHTLTQGNNTKLVLETDVVALLANRRTNKYCEGTLTSKVGGPVYKVDIKPRGKFRRKTNSIPPLKLKFSKKAMNRAGLDTLNEVKIVVPYKDTPEAEQLVIREYIAYRMLEHLTPYSVKARLADIDLNCTSTGQKRKMTCLVVEHEEEVAARLDGHLSDEYGLPNDTFYQSELALIALFEYMIGNTDWEFLMHRNLRLVVPNKGGKVHTVPYDFDFSGLVSAPYASPNSKAGIKTVQERSLMAEGIDKKYLREAALLLKKNEGALLDLCRSKELSDESSKWMLMYVESFFDKVGKSGDVPAKMKSPD